MFGNTLIISCVSGTYSLSLSLSLLLLPPRPTRSQFTFRRVRLFYINRQPLWQGVWLGGGPQIPLKVHLSLSWCLFEDRKSNKGGGRWLAVFRCCFRDNFCLCTDGQTQISPSSEEHIIAIDEGRNQSPVSAWSTRTCTTVAESRSSV